MWDGYGTKSAFYVSEAFYKASGYDISEVRCGRYHLDFDRWIMTSEEQEAFIDSMNLGKQQALYFTGDMGYSLPIFIGLCGLILVTCLCAYLLIYNIMYLSVSGNVRYYGLLQTVGMTGKTDPFPDPQADVSAGSRGNRGRNSDGICSGFSAASVCDPLSGNPGGNGWRY